MSLKKQFGLLSFLIIVLLAPCFDLCSQSFNKDRWSVEGSFASGKITKPDAHVIAILKDGTCREYNLRVGYVDTDTSAFAAAYNYPTFGLGFSMADFSDVKMHSGSGLGNIYALYGFMETSLIRYKKLRLAHLFSIGLSYNTDTYDPVHNRDKIFSSFPIMVYVGMDGRLKYQINNQWEIGIGVNVRHYSNGRLGIMNKGINILGGDASQSCSEDLFY